MTLRANRSTRQGAAINAILEQLTAFRSAQDIYAQLRAAGQKVGLATVYRHLQTLVEAGAVDMVRSIDGEAMYRRCGTHQHHHHLTCRSCGRAEEIEEPAVEAWAERVAGAAGFVATEHTVEISGVCGDCEALPLR